SIGAWAPLPLEQLSLNVRQVLFGTPRRPDLAATMAHLSQRPNVTDLLRELFPALGVYGILVGLGIAGGFELTVAGLFWLAPLFTVVFERFTAVYEFLLRVCLRVRWAVLLLLTLAVVPVWLAAGDIGQELFPEVDASDFTIHVRASGGPRVEETEQQV